MASRWIVKIPQGSPTFIIIRHLTQVFNVQKFHHFSTSNLVGCKKVTPVKFTTNKAAEIPIKEMIGLKSPLTDRPYYEKHVILFSIFIFLTYFCILREENDIDELIQNPKLLKKENMELIDLKIKLNYCKNNNLPTDALRAKIEELEKDHKYVSPFIK